MSDNELLDETLGVHFYSNSGEKVIYIRNIDKADADYFRANKIKISMEEMDGEFITYACPYSDDSEESELIEFANGRSCQEIMSVLAEESRLAFGETVSVQRQDLNSNDKEAL
jgi:hypothetical protein